MHNISDELNLNQIYNIDCLEGMQKIKDKSIDMILCDLPYGTTRNKWDSIIPLTSTITLIHQNKKITMDFEQYQIYCFNQGISMNDCLDNWNKNSIQGLWDYYQRIIKDDGVIILTASQPFTSILVNSNLKMFKYSWVWKKSLKTNFLNAKKQPLRNHEDILVFYRKFKTYNPQGLELGFISGGNKPTGSYNAWNSGTKKHQQTHTNYPASVLEIANPNQGSLHPTQKPLELFEYLIKTYSNAGDIILDTCMGSGTTAISCLQTERHFLGFEKDETYFNIAQNRILQYLNNQKQDKKGQYGNATD